MAGTTPAPPAKSPKKKSTTKPKRIGRGVSYLIVKTLSVSKERSGVSLYALKKALAARGYDVEKNNTRVRLGIKYLVTKGTLIRTKGFGASGSFKLNKTQAEVKKKPAKKAAPKAKKPAAKKPTTAKKAKTAAAKKPAAKKSPKKAKKPAATAAKKTTKSPKKAKKAAATAAKKTTKSPKKAKKPATPKKAAKSPKKVKTAKPKTTKPKPKAAKPKKAAPKKK